MEIKLRLRHPSGDLGPFEVAESLTVAQVKETVFSQWPSGECGCGCAGSRWEGTVMSGANAQTQTRTTRTAAAAAPCARARQRGNAHSLQRACCCSPQAQPAAAALSTPAGALPLILM